MAQLTLDSDLDFLVDMFLTVDFDEPSFSHTDATPFGNNVTSQMSESDDTFVLESELGDDEEVGDGVPDHIQALKHKEIELKSAGIKLKQMGDIFLQEKMNGGKVQTNPTEELKKAMETVGEDKVSQEQAWYSFENIISKSIVDTDSTTKNAFQQLSALLLAVNGLRSMGKATVSMAGSFTKRYIREKRLDEDIKRIGGMDALMRQQLD